MESTDPIDWTQFVQQRITLYPEKFGVWGSYSRDLLRMEESRDTARFTDSLTLQLSTAVLCGQTVSEKPQVELSLPATWYQHLKHAAFDWRLSFSSEGASKFKTAWMWLVARTLFWVLDKYMLKRPVKWTTVKAEVTFEQRVLYPELDLPAHAGRPVIYETMDVSYPDALPPWGSRLRSDPSRFLNRHEIASDIYRDPDGQRYGVSLGPDHVLSWLERNGVNVDQLVKRP